MTREELEKLNASYIEEVVPLLTVGLGRPDAELEARTAPPLNAEQFQPYNREGYINYATRRIRERYARSSSQMIEQGQEWVQYLKPKLNNFYPLLTDFDKQHVIPSTCASTVTPAFTDLDYVGSLAAGDLNFEYEQEIIDTVIEYYKPYIEKYRAEIDPSLSAPRGKGAGWPFPARASDRLRADIILILSAAIAMGGKKAGMTLAEMFQFLSMYHGDSFLVRGERRQHSPKVFPAILRDGVHFSANLEMRVREIYMSPKFAVIWNRVFAKTVIALLLKTDIHNPDKQVIAGKISEWSKNKWKVYALDHSGFDRRHGGKRGLQLIKTLATLMGSPSDDLITEATVPLLTWFRGDPVIAHEFLQLPSGISITTPIGFIGGWAGCVGAIRYALKKVGLKSGVLETKGKLWDALLYGDDTVIALSPDCPFTVEDIKEGYESVGLKIDEEAVVRYLGTVYSPGSFKGSCDLGYPTGRAVQNTFAPEREKLYPFSTIGYIARLYLLGDARAREFHSLMLKMWDVQKLGPPFAFGDREKILNTLVVDAMKKGHTIGQIDDAFNVFTHGLGEQGVAYLPDDIQEMLGDFLGANSYVDLSDITAAAQKLEIPEELIKSYALMIDDFPAYYERTIEQTVQYLNLSYSRGDLVY